MSDDHGAHHKATLLKLAPQSEHILVIGDAEVSPLLVLLNVSGADDDDYLYAVTNLLKHPQFAVGLKSRQHPAGMMVIEELTAQFEIKFSVKL